MKTRATAVVIKDDKVLMIHRFRDGREYYVLPGGKVEEDETTEEAVLRELKEETTVEAKLGPKVFEFEDGLGKIHQLFECHYISGEPHLPEDSVEGLKMNEQNQYYPMWVEIEKINDFTIWPEGTKEILINYVKTN